ncbi:MAG: UvrD-helicase domain-containing protein [Paludibacteraceae bacterium]|nr:UvrD-helicase domain-containing protein [Paludibacteraceae bacterium]
MDRQIDLLKDLNESQQAAVRQIDGPSLVIAGAGSGKTRVLTYKIAYMLQHGVRADSILALTFTNKAAREMRERIEGLVGNREARYLWMGTFHSIFARILRLEAERIGYTSNYTIYDTTDTKNAIKAIVKQKKLDEKTYKPGLLYARISAAKNNLQSPAEYSSDKDAAQTNYALHIPEVPAIYAEYVKRCRLANAMDFDDLLYNTNELFRRYPDVLKLYQERFQFIMVDEYQDTNFAQYLIIKRLAERHHNICVVGDDAQSIYSFRGANIQNILSFQRNYPESVLYKLERNYRSTRTIVDAANSLIKANRHQIPKVVYSEQEKGEMLHVIKAYTDIEEAERVARAIAVQYAEQHIRYDQIAVLYRTNAQSRVIENELRTSGIPYRIYGGRSFYERKEIKDALAYMRLAVNQHDDEALKRIINVPARGIGDTTLNKVLDLSQRLGVSAWEVLAQPDLYNLQVNAGTKRKLMGFSALIDGFRELTESLDAYALAEMIIKQSGLSADALSENTTEGLSRYENLMELLTGVHELQERRSEFGEAQTLLTDYLGEVALLTDQDEQEDNKSRVTLMTIHAAKGLEFESVFIVGLEETLFPSLKSETEDDVEEERRLFYVALTRAKRCCTLSYAQSRFRNGITAFSNPSRFFNDIDEQYMDNPPQRQSRHMDYDYDYEDERESWSREAYPPTPMTAGRATAQRHARPPQATAPLQPRSESGHQARISTAGLRRVGPAYQPDQGKQPVAGTYADGSRVVHNVFGPGTVIRTYSENGTVKIDIDFDKHGKKSLLVRFAKLMKLD